MGSNINTYTVQNSAACGRKCDSVSSCVGFSYNYGRRLCNIKGETRLIVRSSAACRRKCQREVSSCLGVSYNQNRRLCIIKEGTESSGPKFKPTIGVDLFIRNGKN